MQAVFWMPLVNLWSINNVKNYLFGDHIMAKYDPQWDRVVRAIRDHYVMYDKVQEINIRQGVMALEKNWLV